MPKISAKWRDFGTSIFSIMTQKAIASGAVNLAQGFPDFDGPTVIKDAAIAAIKAGRNQYAPAPGVPELRQLLAQRKAEQSQRTYDWHSEVTIFSGASEAIFCALQALFDPGDEILAFEPYFDSYPAAAHSSGARIVGIPLDPPSFTFTRSSLEQAVTKRTRALLLNSPHNPTGRAFNQVELEILRDFVLAHDLLVITDEVYEELVYSPAKHQSIADLPDMAERSIVISSTAKTFSFTGWKVGYAFAPKELTAALRAVHQFTVFCSATPLQYGMIAALELGPEYFSELRQDYRLRRDLLLTELRASGFRAEAPEGTYFIVADYSDLSTVDDLKFASQLTEQHKVAAIPISVFYTDQQLAARRYRYVRFAFCKNQATIAEAGSRLRRIREP
jgi:N-succinyldiaminopimelate aminotransferase